MENPASAIGEVQSGPNRLVYVAQAGPDLTVHENLLPTAKGTFGRSKALLFAGSVG
jgi:hypothetical protein